MNTKMGILLNHILNLTRMGQLKWNTSGDDDSYLLSFSDYSINIFYRPSENLDSGGLEYVIRIYDNEGKVVDEVNNVELDEIERGKNFYKLLDELFVLARRNARGIDEALESMMSDLGILPPEDEDLPF